MNFAPGLIKEIAQHLLGEPNQQPSSEAELRYRNHGSLSIKVEENTFFNHERNEGGGILDLVRHEASIETKAQAVDWLKEHSLIPVEPQKKAATCEAAAYDYRDESDALLFQVVRLEPKTFRQRRPAGTGWEWKVKGTRQVPYRLPELVATPLQKLVYVVEGEKDADRLASLGLLATCNAGGAGKWRKYHSEPLAGRTVIVIPDNDDAGRDHAQKVEKNLKGIAQHVRILELPDLPEKGDVSDWLDAGGTLEQLAQLPTVAPSSAAGAPAGGEDDGEEEVKRSQTDLLVAFARERFELLHDRNGDVFARDLKTSEVRCLGGRQFKDRLIAGFYEKTKIAVRDQSLREALGTLQVLGRFNGEPQAVHIRVAKHGERYYLDLCEPGSSRAVELGAGHWRVVDCPPVLFVRGEAMQPLPTPIAGGSLAPLWSIANVPKDLRLLVLASLIDCLRPDNALSGRGVYWRARFGQKHGGRSAAPRDRSERVGWLSPWISESAVTPDLLAETGYTYTLNWCHDDQPMRMRTRAGRGLWAIPYPQELNDIPMIIARQLDAKDFAQMIIDQFDEMLDQARRQPLVMGIALHPYLVGQPYRLRHLRRALQHIAAERDRGGVWFTTPGAIGRHMDVLASEHHPEAFV